MQKAINLNEQAKRIAAAEGKTVPVNIAQIKEVQRLILEDLAALDVIELVLTLRKVDEGWSFRAYACR